MEKYIIITLVVISALYLLFKGIRAWGRSSSCDTCQSKCSNCSCNKNKGTNNKK